MVPSLPFQLEPLRALAYNLHWTWNGLSRSLFNRLDPELWESTHHNPVLVLGRISQDRLDEVASDVGFLAHLKRAHDALQAYLKSPTWFSRNYPHLDQMQIAYFSFEFGLTECLQSYSGGLGILAGDHLKAASDLGIPLVAIGVNFKDGYFQQYLNSEGWQQERYERNDFENQPMKLVTNGKNQPITVHVSIPDGEVAMQLWEIKVGRISLYLLDTNLEANTPEQRAITERLYGGDTETRIRQEIILGVGGIRALKALGHQPNVCHMNEGHSAFLSLERIRQFMKEEGLTFDEAKNAGYHSNIFTTHTPVPAGIDMFSKHQVEKYLSNSYQQETGISKQDFFRLGTITPEENTDRFNMAHLAMNTSGYINGVAKLHGEVSRKMWVGGFKDIPFNEIPIGHVTNGVHIRSHLAPEMEELLTRYLGEEWLSDPATPRIWEHIEKIPDEELWRSHERRRERLVAFTRRRLRQQIADRGGDARQLHLAGEVLDPAALTIGFARRFATYKRATLIFRDPERLAELLLNPDYPVQIIIAGKAHPQDTQGKHFIQNIFRFANSETFRKKIVFIENYDMNVARYLVEGCDLWLNNPQRPMEASGTSGMKVIANGGLNFSVLDGWWDEAFDASLGWKIGDREETENLELRDEIEAREIYHTLEHSIIPAFYDRGDDKLPRKWVRMMKNSMRVLTPQFNTSRMVKEYFLNYYLPAYEKREFLSEKNWTVLREFTAWKHQIRDAWKDVSVIGVETDSRTSVCKTGDKYTVKATIHLGALTPADVDVQLYYGPDGIPDISANRTVSMKPKTRNEGNDNLYTFTGTILCTDTGRFGVTVRVLPRHRLQAHPFETGCIEWAKTIE